MTLRSLFVGVLVLAGGVWQQPPPPGAPISGHLRWVRGIVTAASPDSLTLKLREDTLTIAMDPATEMVWSGSVDPATRAPADLLAVGGVIEAHYTDRQSNRRAVLIVEAVPGVTAALSRRPGLSYRGIVKAVKRGTLSMLVDTRTRGVGLESRTRLTGADGRLLATGSKEIASHLSGGEAVLVTYLEQSDDIPSGDTTISSTAQKAIEIRKLRTGQ